MHARHTVLTLAIASIVFATAAMASSHREAPNITKYPKLDNTDVYAFRSYEAGKTDAVTLIANFQPFQEPFGGPNYYLMDGLAVYDIHIDNNGDAIPDITYEFRFFNPRKDLTVPVNGVEVPVPLSNIGPFNENDTRALNILQYYTVTVISGGRRVEAVNPFGRTKFYPKPFDNIGSKSIPNYDRYANAHIGLLSYDGCGGAGKTFVGQRREGFKIAVGKIFDLINLNPVGSPNAIVNDLGHLNITSIAIEVPMNCLARSSDPVIGVWSNAHTSTQVNGISGPSVSRLGMPLVNEVVIGLPDKNRFNESRPVDDAQFATYVTNPVLPELIEILFPGVQAPNKFPRTDLVEVFLTGVTGLNKPVGTVKPAEMLRLNTSIAPKAADAQNSLGVRGGDTAGFPNGRRPGDDVVDATLRVAMGALLTDAEAPSRNLPYTDGVGTSATEFRNTFPYLNVPLAGNTPRRL